MDHSHVQKALREMGDSEIAEHSQRFFKAGPGEYREGDQFLGIRIFSVLKVAGQFKGVIT